VINKLLTEEFEDATNLIDGWVHKNTKKCIVIKDGKSKKSLTKGFILLSKMNFDPEGTYKAPYMLEFIYVYPEYRRIGLAFQLLEYVKSRYENCACADNDESRNLFENAGYNVRDIYISGFHNTLYRFP